MIRFWLISYIRISMGGVNERFVPFVRLFCFRLVFFFITANEEAFCCDVSLFRVSFLMPEGSSSSGM